MQRGGALSRVTDGEADVDAGILVAERNQVTRQPVAGNRLAGMHCECSALQVGQLRQDLSRRLDAGQDGAGFDEEQRAGLGQFDATADTVEQFRTMPLFQRRNRCADGGLSQIEHRRSARDVLTFSNGDEYP